MIVFGTDEPLIWTSRGNLPISSLTYRHEWINNENETTLVEEYRLGDEIVKRSVHVYLKKGVSAQSAIGKIGG